MIVVRFLQFLAAMFVVRLVLRAVAALVRTLNAPDQAPPQGPAGGVAELVHDRVCNVHLPRDRALSVKIQGETQYFCSQKCRDEALDRVRKAS